VLDKTSTAMRRKTFKKMGKWSANWC
jgi:hypothetical protein